MRCCYQKLVGPLKRRYCFNFDLSLSGPENAQLHEFLSSDIGQSPLDRFWLKYALDLLVLMLSVFMYVCVDISALVPIIVTTNSAVSDPLRHCEKFEVVVDF